MKKLTLLALIISMSVIYTHAQLNFFNYTDPNQILAIEEDGDYFWAGTNGGLYKWFKSGGGLIGKFHVENGLPGNLVHTIKKDHFYNQLWVGTDKGIAMLNVLNQWTIFTTEDGLADNIVKDIAIDLSGNKWMATANGVSMYNPVLNIWINYTTSEGLIHNSTDAIDVDYQGNVWIGTKEGVSKYDPANNSWTSFTTNEGLSGLRIYEIATDDTKGNVWFATTFGVTKWDGYKMEIYDVDSGLVDNFVSTLAVDAQSNLWIGTDYGVNIFDGTEITDTLTTDDGLASNIINVINIDANNNKWFGNFNGVNQLFHDGSTWTTYTTGEGVIDNRIQAVVVDNTNTKWFGTNEGLSSFDDKFWNSYDNVLANVYVTSAFVDDSAKLWIGTTGGVSVLKDDEWTSYTTGEGLVNDAVRSIAVDSGGIAWVATLDGISSIDGLSFTNYTTSDGLASNDVKAVAIDVKNRKWFATLAGVSMYNDTSWVTLSESDGLVSNNATAISIDEQQNVWIGTQGGLSVYDGSSFTNYTTSDGLVDDWVQSISFDEIGNVWITTSYGVSRFDGLRWVNYLDEDGLAQNDVLSSAVDMDGVIWFGTIGGISKATCEKPEANFYADTACLPGQTIFHNMSGNTDNATTYQWDVNNDGAIDHITKAISHLFTSPGIYTSKLIATNLLCTDTVVKEVVVRIQPDVTLLENTSTTICDGTEASLEAQINNAYIGANYEYSWSNGENTKGIQVSSSDNYILEVIDGNCVSDADTSVVEVLKPFADETICMVSVDEDINKNLVIWEKDFNEGIQSYNIYKLIGNQYSIIGNIPFGDLTVFEDYSSVPDVKAARYAITSVDTCNNESDYSPFHQTIHLGVSAGVTPNTVVLDWTEYIDESGVFKPIWYYIYRGTTADNLVIYDSVSSVIGTEWNDINAGDNLYYRVSVEPKEICDPAFLLKANNGPFSRSISNLEDNRLQATGIDSYAENSFKVFPNPTSEMVSIQNSADEAFSYKLISLDGKVLDSQAVNTHQVDIDVQSFMKGIYILELTSDSHKEVQRIVVE